MNAALEDTIAHARGPSTMPPTTPEAKARYIHASGSRPLDGFTIKRAIGRGGFGEVYYATSDAGKEVALKLILRNLEVERRGVQQCMNLKSPNLVTVYDLRENDEGDSFVLMEYVNGPSLASVLAQHPAGLPPHELRAWLKGLVEGVAYLHDHGIVHRDLKPGNLFMEDGVVKIGDYGLSKAITGSQLPGHSESVGTCHYMAPEISTGKYTKAIDVYALGVILYEIITGRVPFDGESVGEVLMKHLTARPDLSVIPEPYRATIARALAKDPNHRPKNVFELLPPEDAARSRASAAEVAPKGPESEVLRIIEDSVFYIGPNTWPTRDGRPPTWRQRLLGRRRAPSPARPAAAPPRPVAPIQPVALRRPVPPPPPPAPVRRAPTPPPAPAPPPPPAPLPGPRVRVAELATSMLVATPLAAVAAALALPVGTVFDTWIPVEPDQVAALFGLILLATWGVLTAGKWAEGRGIEPRARRLAGFGVGSATGAALLGLHDWASLDLGPFGEFARQRPELASYVGPLAHSAMPGYLEIAAFFGLAFGLVGWWKLTARDRGSRIRVLPLVTTGLLAAILAAFWPETPPKFWGPPVLVATALIAQVVSPWDRAAARYARWAKKAKKAPAKVA